MGLSESKLSSVNASNSNIRVLQKARIFSQLRMDRKKTLVHWREDLRKISPKILVKTVYIDMNIGIDISIFISTYSW